MHLGLFFIEFKVALVYIMKFVYLSSIASKLELVKSSYRKLVREVRGTIKLIYFDVSLLKLTLVVFKVR